MPRTRTHESVFITYRRIDKSDEKSAKINRFRFIFKRYIIFIENNAVYLKEFI